MGLPAEGVDTERLEADGTPSPFRRGIRVRGPTTTPGVHPRRSIMYVSSYREVRWTHQTQTGVQTRSLANQPERATLAGDQATRTSVDSRGGACGTLDSFSMALLDFTVSVRRLPLARHCVLAVTPHASPIPKHLGSWFSMQQARHSVSLDLRTVDGKQCSAGVASKG